MTDPLDLQITITLFSDNRAADLQTARISMRDLAPKIQAKTAASKETLPWLKLATFGDHRTPKGSLRNNANILTVTGVEGDYDGKRMTPEEGASRLAAAGVAALIYTSPSHMTDLPKWRVLCPFSRPLTGDTPGAVVAARREHIGRVNAILGNVMAPESFVGSQAYYFGSVDSNPDHSVILVPGDYLDWVFGPDPVYPTTNTPTVALPGLPAGAGPSEAATAALASAVDLFERPEAIAIGRHQVVLAATAAVAPFVLSGHLQQDHVLAAIETACDGSGRAPFDGEVLSALEGALRVAQPYEPPTYDDVFEVLPAPPPEPRLLEITEDEASVAFCDRYAGSFAYDATDQAWFRFTRSIGWEPDLDMAITRTVRNFVRAARHTWGMEESEKAGSIGFSTAVERGARSDHRFAVTQATWDSDPWQLGVPGGHVDLRTGELRAASSLVYMKRRTSVSPVSGDPVRWLSFLSEACGGDDSLIAWLQRLCGYILTGDMSEEVFAFLYGPGGNGKSVFMGAVIAILGNYAYNAPSELFKTDSRTNREYQMAALPGVRLVVASETESGTILAESMMKELTGKEGLINARNPYGRPFQFNSQAKVVIVGNHAPRLANGRTKSMERRMRVVPFNRVPSVVDLDLKDRLIPEYGQILSWMIGGCVDWQANQLGRVDAVTGASAAYFGEQDMIEQWLTDRCDRDPQVSHASSELLADFNAWLRTAGERACDNRAFKEWLNGISGIRLAHSKKGSVYHGVTLKTSDITGLLD